MQAKTESGFRVRRRAQMYQTALELFRVQGYYGTTVEQIADSAGVSRRTFFNYFPAKESVLAEIFNSVTTACVEELCADHHASAGHAIWSALEGFGRLLEGDHALAVELFRVSFSSGTMRRQDQHDVAKLFPVLIDKIREAQANDEIAEDLDAPELAGHLMAVATGALKNWAAHPDSGAGDLARLLRTRLGFARRGLEPRS